MASLKAPRFGYSFFSLEAFLEWALSFETLRKFKGHVFFAALQCGQHCRLTILDGLAEFGKYQCQYHTTRSKYIF